MASKKKPSKSISPVADEGLFALWLILFGILEILVVMLILVGSLTGGAKTPTGDGGTNGTTEQSTQDPTPPEERPVFSGASIPTRPGEDAATESLSAQLYSNYGILVDAESGSILAEKNADKTFSPASMTKVMTLIVACEQYTNEDLDRRVTVTEEMLKYATSGEYRGSTCFGFDAGDEVTVKDLLYGIGLVSASDCVVPIVFDLCGDEEDFVKLMNERADQMGLTSTHFDNAIGFESEDNYTTAREMAMILSVALQSELISDILSRDVYRSQAYYEKNGNITPYGITFKSTLHDHRIQSYESVVGEDFTLKTAKLIGGKTGFLESSFLVCYAEGKTDGSYVLVLGDAQGSNTKTSCARTMQDVKYLLDTYVK